MLGTVRGRFIGITAVTMSALGLFASIPGSSASVSSGGADGAQAATAHDWGDPVDRDEFDGNKLDTNKWGVYDGPGHDGNGRRTPDQVSVSDGALRITGLPNGDTGGIAWQNGEQYGRYEARMRVNQEDQGGNPYHPVLILWPDSEDWPDGGELDYAESDAGEQKVDAFLHYGDGSEDGGQQQFSTEADLSEWHDYAVEWTPDAVVGYVDGKEWFRATDDVVQPPGPMHQTIQLDNFFPENGLNKATMDVDWVRKYKV